MFLPAISGLLSSPPISRRLLPAISTVHQLKIRAGGGGVAPSPPPRSYHILHLPSASYLEYYLSIIDSGGTSSLFHSSLFGYTKSLFGIVVRHSLIDSVGLAALYP